MKAGIILTFNHQVSLLLVKRKDKFIAKFMASQSLLDYILSFSNWYV